ncbi:MAG: hypothetical protein P857_652 [Candidatus Xenolissoclinum pacificiensis L6]|uniref:Uncharacterized protein n=1 Tax=Candidatus Xenolissoclinum pacificiensis L6 TaxID=1401685 RepID=W2UZ06_9RICK|nr:MAG: hypothetical protein P857_652 [Candidatus Xenolissoclinum pacificiensis L6]
MLIQSCTPEDRTPLYVVSVNCQYDPSVVNSQCIFGTISTRNKCISVLPVDEKITIIDLDVTQGLKILYDIGQSLDEEQSKVYRKCNDNFEISFKRCGGQIKKSITCINNCQYS